MAQSKKSQKKKEMAEIEKKLETKEVIKSMIILMLSALLIIASACLYRLYQIKDEKTQIECYSTYNNTLITGSSMNQFFSTEASKSLGVIIRDHTCTDDTKYVRVYNKYPYSEDLLKIEDGYVYLSKEQFEDLMKVDGVTNSYITQNKFAENINCEVKEPYATYPMKFNCRLIINSSREVKAIYFNYIR